MNYIIQTPSASRLKKEILNCVSVKADANGNRIDNWKCTEIEEGEKALVLTSDQWEDKGYISLKIEPIRSELQIRYHSSEICYNQENGDDKIIFGRFSELLLVHFKYLVDKIIIE